MSKGENVTYYGAPDPYLQQGDIFSIDIVGPSADEEARAFRTADGRHGSAVFEEGCEGRIFSLRALNGLLASTDPRTELHTEPFTCTPDGQGEMVVVYGRLFRYFVIASHTCDVSGLDKKEPLQWCTILPVFTLGETCRSTRLPFRGQPRSATIEEYLATNWLEARELAETADFEYGKRMRDVVTGILAAGVSGKAGKDVNQIRNFLNRYHAKKIMFSLPAEEHFGLPESYVDFSAVFTVPTERLHAIRHRRLARIIDPYRTSFSRRFAELFARTTLPQPMVPPSA